MAIDSPMHINNKVTLLDTQGNMINRINNDAETLSFAFGRLLNMISSAVASMIIIVYVFFNSWIIGLEIVLLVILILSGLFIILIIMKTKDLYARGCAKIQKMSCHLRNCVTSPSHRAFSSRTSCITLCNNFLSVSSISVWRASW